jgi:DGQHR domain-containing protein
VKSTDFKDHIRTKNEAAGEIKKHLNNYMQELIKLFPDKKDIISKHDVDRIKIFSLYISRNEIKLGDHEHILFGNLIFVQPKTLDYFQWIVGCIKLSAKNEVFRFLKLKSSDVGTLSNKSNNTSLAAPIIYPKGITGLSNKVRVVSFMMSAEDLLSTCFVLRKDNWEDSIWLYQRLIDKKNINKIRGFLEMKGQAFYNNIIVALPDNAYILDASGQPKGIEEVGDFEGNCELVLPKEMNSICVIDGQHRIFAHYESGSDSKQERTIAKLRKQLHLLVTGLVFPKDMRLEERAHIQSEIFLDINSNAKPVPPNVLLQIKRIQNPIADESIAQLVIEQLNKEGIFKDLLQVSSLETGKIKTASIVRFALRNLVTVNPADEKVSLFNYWDGNKDSLLSINEKVLQDYIIFCSKTLRNYFGAVKKRFERQWRSGEDSKLLSVIAINGFIIALTRQLKTNGVQDFDFYDQKFEDWSISFSKDDFPYTSSQYRKFSNQILEDVFGFTEDQLETI